MHLIFGGNINTKIRGGNGKPKIHDLYLVIDQESHIALYCSCKGILILWGLKVHGFSAKLDCLKASFDNVPYHS